MKPLLEIHDLRKSFGGVNAVDGLDFHVKEGEILGVIGPNGSGKTTLFNLITGFLKPTAGKIHFQGKDIAGMRPHRIASAATSMRGNSPTAGRRRSPSPSGLPHSRSCSCSTSRSRASPRLGSRPSAS